MIRLRGVLYRNITENQFWPKGQKNFFESGGFAMGRSGYLKHEYYFAPPWEAPALARKEETTHITQTQVPLLQTTAMT